MLEKSQHKETQTKRSFSYHDIMQMKSHSIYSALGNTITSQLPSAPRATFGKQQRSTSKKKFPGKQLQHQLAGKQGIGPAAYLPPRYTLPDGKIVQGKDPAIDFNYESVPAFTIGKQQRKLTETIMYQYMKHDNDHVDVDKADLRRKNSSPSILIGTARRFSQQRLDKITPGPTYDPVPKPQHIVAPKYSMASRNAVKGHDPLVPSGSTTTLVGPGAYFQKVKKTHSTSSLSRIPYDSKIKKQPIVTFPKAPRTLKQIRNSVDQTYDIKSKTLMAHYDFEYDGGKGYQSGRSYTKKNIISSMQNPIERNKMGSFTIGRSSRQKQQQKRGFFKNTMTNAPQTVRISIPKF